MYIIFIKTTFRDTYFFDTMHDSLQFSYICEQPFMFENKTTDDENVVDAVLYTSYEKGTRGVAATCGHFSTSFFLVRRRGFIRVGRLEEYFKSTESELEVDGFQFLKN